MNGNAVFIIILIVIYVCAVYGKHMGLFRTLVPLLTMLISLWLVALILPDFAKRLSDDALRLEFKELMIDVLAYVVTFIIVRAAFKLLLKLMGPVIDLPGLRHIDRTMGLFAGLVFGIFIVWLVFFLSVFLLGREQMQPFLDMVEHSEPLKFIYNHNLLMTFINKTVFKS
ncbi:MAG: CvpA family protein [Lachnospiraceae bacterium]|nr:CvpA family protein [Lachnospiraceae bacterium]